jgi:hypothetical protein
MDVPAIRDGSDWGGHGFSRAVQVRAYFFSRSANAFHPGKRWLTNNSGELGFGTTEVVPSKD